MITVALVTNWNAKDGMAEHAEHLVRHSDKRKVNYLVCSHDKWDENYLKSLDYDILHVNYAEGQFGCEPMLARVAQHKGKATIITQHLSVQGNNFQHNPFLRNFNKVVIHEKVNDGTIYIPMGIPLVDVSNIPITNSVGTAGFPQPWKQLREIGYAANYCRMGFTCIAPETGHADTYAAKKTVIEVCGHVNWITEWLSYDKVVQTLASQICNAYAYKTTGMGKYIDVGTSASVRMAIAAKRPVVVTRDCRQFQDLKEYEDEVYFAESGWSMHLVPAIEKAKQEQKIPKRLLNDMSWTRCAELYYQHYRDLLRN